MPTDSGYRIWLTRIVYHVVHDGRDGYETNNYVKAVTLPLPPAVGIGIIVDPNCDPEEFERVYVNESGAIVCQLPHFVEDMEYTPEGWAEQKAWLTTGWDRLYRGFPQYTMAPPA